MRITEIEQARARREIARQMADIMAMGYTVTVLQDCHIFLEVRIVHDDQTAAIEGDWERVTEGEMLIDPLGFYERLLAEIQTGAVH
jgi:hypothetical protein